MTSFGRASGSLGQRNINIELKTLNSKFVDLRLKIPNDLQEHEMELRKILHDKVIRGKIEASFTIENSEGLSENYAINQQAFEGYYSQLVQVSKRLNLDQADMLSTIMRMPDVVSTAENILSQDEWQQVLSVLNKAIDNLVKHRQDEGKAIQKDLTHQIGYIIQRLQDILPFEKERIEKVRSRMHSSLDDYLSRENIDENRFEQEVLFYLEKMDITEEKVRLQQHCDYFLEEMKNDNLGKGRKLNFISQEMGREINTLGAKAYSSDIQRHVVQMKDSLEKIKEQLANIV